MVNKLFLSNKYPYFWEFGVQFFLGFRLVSWPVILPQAGIDTEYWRQSLELYEIFHRFVQGYLACYYPKKEDDFLMDKNPGKVMREGVFEDVTF